MKAYKVKWIDSQSSDSWELYNMRTETLPVIATSMGFKIFESKTVIRLALNIAKNQDGSNKQYSCTMSIPKCSILKMKRIKL